MERKLYAALRGGRVFKGDLAVSYQRFGISTKTLDVLRSLGALQRRVAVSGREQANRLGG